MGEVNNNQEKTLIAFLKEAREGVYAPIDESSLEYIRIQDEQEDIEVLDENFYYSIS